MHSLFWTEVFKPDVEKDALFEQRGGKYLPKKGAPLDKLENAGRCITGPALVSLHSGPIHTSTSPLPTRCAAACC